MFTSSRFCRFLEVVPNTAGISFDAASQRFSRFLESKGHSPDLEWFFARDGLLWRRKLFAGPERSHEERRAAAERLFHAEKAQSLGVEFRLIGESRAKSVCTVVVPAEASDGSASGFSMAIELRPMRAWFVRNSALWAMLKRVLPSRLHLLWFLADE